MTKLPNREPAGTPAGGRFKEGQKGDPDPDVTLGDRRGRGPMMVGEWDEFPGDGDVVSRYEFGRRDKVTYDAAAVVPGGTMSYLLGAEDVPTDDFNTVMSGPRWRSASSFLDNRYPNSYVSDLGDGDEIVFRVEATFDHQPGDEDNAVVRVVDATWDEAATIHNETDAGTFGSEFVGDRLRERLDSQAFLDVPFRSEGRWLPEEPMSSEGAAAEAKLADLTGRAVSDRAAYRIASDLLERRSGQGDPVTAELWSLTTPFSGGFARRDVLRDAAASEDGPDGATLAALSRWADRQPTTSELFDRVRRAGVAPEIPAQV